MDELFNRIKPEEEVRQMSPLVWAYVGDSVYELYLRTHFINTTKKKAHELHVKAIGYARASAQYEFLKKIQERLTRRRARYYKERKEYTKPSCTEKCRSRTIYVCYCIRRSNWLSLFNKK